MKIFPALRFASLACTALAFSSCASVSVKSVQNGESAKPQAKPVHIYVEAFDVGHTDVKEHPMRKNPGQLKTEAREMLAKYLVADLSAHIAPASLLVAGAAPRTAGWLVSGEITRLNEGSRFLRMAFGLGMGGTKMETRAAVRNLPRKNTPFLKFDTSGGSGASPGAATNPIPFSSVPSAVMASKGGITDDAQRTARMITAEIAQYAVRRGWIPSESAPKVKRAR